jgi:spermidine/putrescine transport system ATP-binding protein
MSDRIGVMDFGKLLQVGTPEDIYENPVSRFVAEFIGETNFIDGTVTDDGRIRIGGGELVFARSEAPAGTDVTLTLRPEKIQIHTRNDPGIPSERNQLPAMITRQLYFGESIYYEIEIPGGETVDARLENIPSLRRWTVGEMITMSFHREAAEALTS